MRTLRSVMAIVLFLGLSAAAMAGSKEDRLMQEVTALGDALAKAMLEDNIDLMLGMYTEDAISLPNFGPRMDGLDEFRANHDQMAAAGMKVTAFASDPTEVWNAGNHVIEIGTYSIALEMPGSPGTVEDKGKYMTVYVRDANGELKIKAETWNTDMNPMEMGAPEHE